MDEFMAFRDIAFDMSTHPTAGVPGTVQEIGVVDLGSVHGRDLDFHPPFRSAFHDALSLRQVLQSIGQRCSAVERLGDWAASVLESWKKTCVPTARIAARSSVGC
jgi:hypothetical protein